MRYNFCFSSKEKYLNSFDTHYKHNGFYHRRFLKVISENTLSSLNKFKYDIN